MNMSHEETRALLAAAAPLIELAIAEDIDGGDVTSNSLLPEDQNLTGRFVVKRDGVIAGLPVVRALLAAVDSRLRFEALAEDGDRVKAGELVATASGSGRSLLAAERTALNFLQRMSGIATTTRACVDAVAGTGALILDTRKTLPGFRVLDKHAVRAGGGVNHRMGLYDMFLIKDNHIDAVGDLENAVRMARRSRPDLRIEVEVRDLSELQRALALDPLPDRIMLDNMDLVTMRAAVDSTHGRTALEASGGVDIGNVRDIAATGVDAISIGALTHSAKALDISMKTGLVAR